MSTAARPARTATPLPEVHTLPNGVRLLALVLPDHASVCASVFVRSGSRHEGRRDNGISHVVEHMAFKGTATRDCQRINLDAERLGAEVNAHTDRDHTAFHMRGLARDTSALLRQLGDIVRHGSFPADELERERQVILHELTEVEDDPVATAFTLFDRCCWGAHAAAQPVIGTRANIRRFSRDDLLAYVQRQYTGANTLVAVAGAIDPQALLKDVEHAFGDMPAGQPNPLPPPQWLGGYAARRQAGSSQVQVVLGWPIPPLQDPAHVDAVVAAALFGEGMSSPLLDTIRERRGLVYHAACSADVMDGLGQFVIEAATGPEHLDELFDAVAMLLKAQLARTDAVDLERARNQIIVKALSAQERPFRQLEDAALDLFILGRIRPRDEQLAAVQAVDGPRLRAAFAAMLAATPALALAGRPGRRTDAGVLEKFRV